MKTWLLSLPLALALGACAQTHGIAIPSSTLAATERIDLDGLGGWHEGRFRIGRSDVQFSRSSGRSRIDTLAHTSGGAVFTTAGPELGAASGRCRFDEQELDSGLVAFPVERLSYHCRFDQGERGLAGALVLGEVPNGTGKLAGRTRAGTVNLGDVRLDIRPIHQFDRGKAKAGSPLGYSFHRDGRQVGAVDLSGFTKRIHAPVEPGAERDSVMLAGLALSLFWDPGS